jgi:hypothetical protein
MHKTMDACLLAADAARMAARASEIAAKGPDKSAALGAASAAVRAATAAIALARQHNAMEPDMTRTGIFQNHNCSTCDSGAKPCIHPRGINECMIPHARND